MSTPSNFNSLHEGSSVDVGEGKIWRPSGERESAPAPLLATIPNTEWQSLVHA